MRLQRLLRSIRLKWFLRSEKSLLRTSESSWFLNSIIWGQKYFSLAFWKNKLTESWKLKCHNLRNTQIHSNKIQLVYFYLSDSIYKKHFKVRYPVLIPRRETMEKSKQEKADICSPILVLSNLQSQQCEKNSVGATIFAFVFFWKAWKAKLDGTLFWNSWLWKTVWAE